MLPLARKALTLVFLISSSNRGGGGGQHGASPSFLVEALPLDNKSPSTNDIGEVTPQRSTSSWCPSTRPRLSKCLSAHGQKCPESTILGVLVVNASITADEGPPTLFSSGADCVMYFLNTDSVVSNETKIFSSAYLPINTTSIQLVFRVRVNDSTCILNVQQYNYTDQDCERVEKNVSSFPFCTQISYNCAGEEERRLIAELESRGVLLRTLRTELQKPPLPLVAHSKSTELRRVERAEVIRRVKKPISWNWRDHILEISLVSIVAAVLILIGLKRCLAGTRRLMNLSSHSRVVRFDLDELDEKRRRFSSCVMSSPPRQIDVTKNPSKPILKNRPKLSHPPLNRVLGQTHPSAIKSFDSSSSIYYDAIEGPSSAAVVAPPEEGSSHSQPLISEF